MSRHVRRGGAGGVLRLGEKWVVECVLVREREAVTSLGELNTLLLGFAC